MTTSLKNKTIKGTIWSFIERFSVQGISFLVMIIMARLLTPSDYGIVGMITIFIAISQALVDGGFSQALIRKQNRSEVDNSTIFYFNITAGLSLYLILFVSAPLIANFYNEPLLVKITRIISLNIVINSFIVVQRAILTVKIDFKTQAKASLIAAILSGICGIWMAYSGLGLWSIVSYQIIYVLVNCILLWILSKWRPKLIFSIQSLQELFGFGSRLSISTIIDTIYRNMYLLVIGKFFNSSDLGYYTRAQQFAEFPSQNITSILQRVTYPILCTIQDDKARLSEAYRKFLRISAYIIFPLMLGLAALSKPIIILILKEQWLFTANILPLLCFALMWYPIHAINLNLLQVEGRSDLLLRTEIIKKIIGVAILIISIPCGIYGICIGLIINSIISLIINTYYTGKLISVGFFLQMKDLTPIFIISLIMGIIIHIITICLPMAPIFSVLTGLLVGPCIYYLLSRILNLNELTQLISIFNTSSNK